MELRHLRYFVGVVEHGGYRRAADHLHVAQAAISQTVAVLEEELDLKLFERLGRGVKLTPAGEAFHKESLKTLRQADVAVDAARRASSGQTGTLRLAYPSVATSGFLPGLVKSFKAKLPNVKLVMQELNHIALEAALSEGRIDLAIARLPLSSAFSGRVDCIHLVSEPLVAAVPANESRRRKRVAVKELKEEPLIVCQRESAPGVYDAVVRLCAEAGFSARIEHEADVMQTSLTLVAAGQGTAILPMMCALNLRHEDVRLLRLQPDSYRGELSAVWLKDVVSLSLKLFTGLLRGSAKNIEDSALKELQNAVGSTARFLDGDVRRNGNAPPPTSPDGPQES